VRKCRFCHEDIDDAARVCVHCGRDLFGGHTIAATDAPPAPVTQPGPPVEAPMTAAPPRAIEVVADVHPPVTHVSVVDLNMPFSSMVGFMIKWALASIPAAIILGIVVGGLWFVLMTVIAVVR
jgi:hypothetical protein